MSSPSSSVWGYLLRPQGRMELTEELRATLTSQETPILGLCCTFDIKNICESNSSSEEQVFRVEENWNSEHWDVVLDLRFFTHTLSLAKHSIHRMMTQTSAWVWVPSDIRETMITRIASALMECQINEGSSTALGYALIPCFQLNVAMVIDDEEELNFRLAAQQSFDAAQRDDVLQSRPVFAALLESLVTEIVGEVEDDKEECVICKDEFVTGAEVKRLPCSHRFHEKCITRWFQQKNTCPLCRHNIQV